ncbi:MAG: hypothetical protein HFJ43_02780 [Clostridia bacterium]|nr:hypothetical protein [Clostridia bacterium]
MTNTRQLEKIGSVDEMYPKGILMGHTYTYPQAVAVKKSQVEKMEQLEGILEIKVTIENFGPDKYYVHNKSTYYKQ